MFKYDDCVRKVGEEQLGRIFNGQPTNGKWCVVYIGYCRFIPEDQLEKGTEEEYQKQHVGMTNLGN